jgi:hypothetical protein
MQGHNHQDQDLFCLWTDYAEDNSIFPGGDARNHQPAA